VRLANLPVNTRWTVRMTRTSQNEDHLRASLTSKMIYNRSSRHIQPLEQVSSALSPTTFTRQILATSSGFRKGTVIKEELARRWQCGLDIIIMKIYFIPLLSLSTTEPKVNPRWERSRRTHPRIPFHRMITLFIKVRGNYAPTTHPY
jgi:hypothetical protein